MERRKRFFCSFLTPGNSGKRHTGDMSRLDHETVSFAEFLDYRARRMRAPVVDAPAPPGVITPPPDPPEPRRDAVDTIMTPGPRV